MRPTKKTAAMEKEIKRDVATLKAKIARLKADYAREDKKAKSQLQAKISGAKATLKGTHDRAKAALDGTNREMNAKIRDLRIKLAGAKGAAKNRWQERIAMAQSDYNHRARRLHKAWQLTKKALAM